MMRSLRSIGLVVSIAACTSLAPVATATPPTLADQLASFGDSLDDLGKATSRVVEARQRYSDQLGKMRDAALDLFTLFGIDDADTPVTKPEAPKVTSLLASLRLHTTKPVLTPPAKLFDLARVGERARPLPALAVAKPVLAKPIITRPLGRLASLLIPAKPAAIDLDVRVRDPHGTSLYDLLTFD